MKKSLADLSLFKKIIADPNLSIVRMPYDANWKYEKHLPDLAAGFNPYTGHIYIPAKSAIAQWIDQGMKNDRDFNEADILINEFAFLMHDYLHVWSASIIHEVMLEIGLHEKIPTKELSDAFVFLHLLTEAAATVGLDYWYLSTFKVDQKCDLGTLFSSLTVSYNEDDITEYRKFNPEFTAQHPDMFGFIHNFYCSGKFEGFDLDAMRQSPKIYDWLKHELEYGETQRRYVRMWYAHLSNGALNYTEEELIAPIGQVDACLEPLVAQVQNKLWQLIKTNEYQGIVDLKSMPYPLIKSHIDQIDFQFTNIHTDFDQIIKLSQSQDLSPTSKSVGLTQLISSYDYATFPKMLLSALPWLMDGQRYALTIQMLDFWQLKPLDVVAHKTKDLFYLG